MNVLMLTRDVNVLREGSAARKLVIEYAALTKHLFVIVLNTRKERFIIQKVSNTLWIYPVNAFAWWSTPFAALRVAGREVWFQNRLQVDIVSALDPSESGFAGWLIVRISGKPLLVDMQQDVLDPRFQDESLINLVRSFLARLVLRRAQSIRVISEEAKESLEEISPAVAKRAFVLRRFVDTYAISHEPTRVDLHKKYPRFHFVILVISPLVREQNIGLAIHVLVSVLQHVRQAGLVIVGEGPDHKHLKNLADQLGVGDRVVFEKRSADVASYYKTANVFLVTASHEDYGDTLREAVACGAVIVTTKVGLASSVIEHGVSGFVCDVNDPESFIRAVMQIIERPGIRETIKINARVDTEGREGKEKEEYLHAYGEAWKRLMPGR